MSFLSKCKGNPDKRPVNKFYLSSMGKSNNIVNWFTICESTMSFILTSASPATVYAFYKDTDKWPMWDHDIKDVILQKGLEVGARGKMAFAKGPNVDFVVSALEENCSFETMSFLPGCRILFGHHLEKIDEHTRVSHVVNFEGMTAPLFRRLIGRSIERSIPMSLERLKKLSECEHVRVS